MKKYLSALIAAALCAASIPNFANVNLVNAFAPQTANTSCPAAGSMDVGNYTGPEWCGDPKNAHPPLTTYLGEAVAQCEANCATPHPPSCSTSYLPGAIKHNVNARGTICMRECAAHDLPGVYNSADCSTSAPVVLSCESEWQDYASHC